MTVSAVPVVDLMNLMILLAQRTIIISKQEQFKLTRVNDEIDGWLSIHSLARNDLPDLVTRGEAFIVKR
jgi:hypothetical protein